MDPLLQPPLRLQPVGKPVPLSSTQAKEEFEAFIASFKNRSGTTDAVSGGNDATDVSTSGVLMSQLSRLRNGLEEASEQYT